LTEAINPAEGCHYFLLSNKPAIIFPETASLP